MLNLVISGKLEEVEEIDQNICPIVARMDFIDPGIGDEVLDIVSKWVRGLKEADEERGKFTVFLQKNKRKVAFVLNYLSMFIIMLYCFNIVNTKILQLPIKFINEMTTSQLSDILKIIFFAQLVVL